eukprot:2323608-Amphidinium_carterae.1
MSPTINIKHQLADAEFSREVQAGYAVVHQSRAEAEKAVGPLIPSRVAAVVKTIRAVKSRLA